MQDIKSSKAAGVDKLLGRFLKDCADTLTKPISSFCNLSPKESFQVLAKLQN